MRETATPCFRTRRAFALFAPAAMMVLAAGCSLARPQVRATDVRVLESSGGTTKVEIGLELRNTSTEEVDLVEYSYVLSLPDGASYGGKWAALRALPPEQTITATIPAVLPTASVDGARSWRVSGNLRYRDPQSIARILYEAGILRTEVGFSGSGESLTRKPESAPAPTAAPAARP